MVAYLLTTVEAAPLLGISRQTLARWVDEGHAHPAKRMPGQRGAFVFTADEVERLRSAPRPRKPYSRRRRAA